MRMWPQLLWVSSVVWAAFGAPPCLAAVGTSAEATPVAPSPPARDRTDRQDLHLDQLSLAQPAPLLSVAFEGLRKTHARVVRRELTVVIGQRLRKEALKESVTRLRSLGIFRRVDVRVEARTSQRGAPGWHVVLSFDEKWSLLPVISAGRSGGRLFLKLGVQDGNFLGRYWGVQGYYWYFAGTHSGVVAFTNPRLFDARVSGGAVIELGNRNRYVFTSGGQVAGGWSRHRQRLTLEVADLRDPERPRGLTLSLLEDRFTKSMLDPTLVPSEVAAETSTPQDSRWLIARFWGQVGRMITDDYLEEGALLRVSAAGGVSWTEGVSPWCRAQATGKLAWLGPRRLNAVARLQLGGQNETHPEHLLFLGGFTGVRGYAESRFAGTAVAAGNLELRLPSLHGRWLVVQHVAFVDGGVIRRVGLAGADRSPRWVPALSAGTGVRGIVPALIGMVARLDVAWKLLEQGWLVSFGAQQYF